MVLMLLLLSLWQVPKTGGRVFAGGSPQPTQRCAAPDAFDTQSSRLQQQSHPLELLPPTHPRCQQTLNPEGGQGGEGRQEGEAGNGGGEGEVGPQTFL